jgi:hypothetical protein
MVESERAKLGTGVRFSFTALDRPVRPAVASIKKMSRLRGRVRGLQNREAGFDSRPALQEKRPRPDGRDAVF